MENRGGIPRVGQSTNGCENDRTGEAGIASMVGAA